MVENAQTEIMWCLAHYPTSEITKNDDDRGQILTDFPDFYVVEKPWVSAFQRRKKQQKL